MSTTRAAPDDHQSGRCEIRLKGRLDGLSISHESDGDTVIQGPVADQAALYGLLRKVRDLGLPLVSVICVEPDPLDGSTIEPR